MQNTDFLVSVPRVSNTILSGALHPAVGMESEALYKLYKVPCVSGTLLGFVCGCLPVDTIHFMCQYHRYKMPAYACIQMRFRFYIDMWYNKKKSLLTHLSREVVPLTRPSPDPINAILYYYFTLNARLRILALDSSLPMTIKSYSSRRFLSSGGRFSGSPIFWWYCRINSTTSGENTAFDKKKIH